MSDYIVVFMFHETQQAQLPARWGVGDLKDGFWVRRDEERPLGTRYPIDMTSKGQYFIPYHQVRYVYRGRLAT